jgi:glycyl-tRNA synthetase
VKPGWAAGEVLAERLPQVIAGLKFELSMRWNASQVYFSRPIRWFVALLGDAVVPFVYADVPSGRVSRGLRSENSPAFEIPSASAYFDTLARQNIVVDVAERRQRIAAQIRALAAEVGGHIPEDTALLDEVTNLVEHPTALRGSFDRKYLHLPQEVLITVMKKHQRYFPVLDESGKLLPYFIAVRNGDTRHLDVVREGNEAVLTARYADAEFFFAEDRQKPLEAFLPILDTLTFQEKLGSMLAKARRIEALTQRLAEALGLAAPERDVAARAAHLCKADLATKMVVELTSLQGVMGREYALLSGEKREVAVAIYEHYLPRYAGDALPETMPGVVVGLADRLDSLVGLFAAGLAPKGSADPYGLRRAALGVVQVLTEKGISLDLRQAIRWAAEIMPIPADEATQAGVLDFIAGRQRAALLDAGYRYDVVDAVLAERGHDPVRAARAVKALAAWVERPDWQDVLNAYARTRRIVRGLAEKHPLRPELLAEPAAQALYHAYQKARARVRPDGSVDDLMEALVDLKDPINRFFDEILVMAEDPDVRAARLGLCQAVSALADGIVDLSKVEGF